eukprot:TRINITY_DN5915_c0_g1_i3.p1 TRINITY_DN5915_c0_g1~~TRINITY_DN5915_c0_g1_i3.p1  ORF type:complete len:245 (+),score=41.68 TRINITY_DN5915_c0_g1_i3:57-737(+)
MPDHKTGETRGFIFKKKIWLDEFSADDVLADAVMSTLIFQQMKDDFLNSRVALSLKETVSFSSLLVNSKLGGSKGLTASNVQEFVPRHLKSAKKSSEWLAYIGDACFEVAGVTGKQGTRMFIHKWINLDVYGCAVFPITQNDRVELPGKLWLLINMDYVVLVHPLQHEPIVKWDYNQVSQWIPTADGWTMVVGDLFKPEKYIFQSPWTTEIFDLYMVYMTVFEERT